MVIIISNEPQVSASCQDEKSLIKIIHKEKIKTRQYDLSGTFEFS